MNTGAYSCTSPRVRPERASPAAMFGRTHSDRKSTRLNSSHEWISYAVFCLKKKKNYCAVTFYSSILAEEAFHSVRTAGHLAPPLVDHRRMGAHTSERDSAVPVDRRLATSDE